MRVLYLLQTYKNLPQIVRLVRTIKRSSPRAAVLISQNADSFTIDPAVFADLPDVHVTHVSNINRADFSVMQAYLDGIARARALEIDFDWLVNMTGQCYPARPLDQLEHMLATTSYDGFMDSYEALVPSEHNPWDRREIVHRYGYQYRWRLTTSELPNVLRKVLSPPRRIFNNVQPFFRIDTGYGLQLGLRGRKEIIGRFRLYGGSFFKTLSRRAVDYLCRFVEQHTAVTDYFRSTLIPDEVLPQTILLNNPELTFSSDSLYYIKWDGGKQGRPRILTTSDYETIVARNVFFARKFEPAEDSHILDMLDARVFSTARTPEPPRPVLV